MFSTQFLKINYLIFIVTFGGSGVPGWWKKHEKLYILQIYENEN